MSQTEVRKLAETQHGVVSRTQLRSLGRSFESISALATSPNWEAVTDEVFRRVGSAPTQAQQVMAAVLDSGGDSALSHLPGAGWWGVKGCSLFPLRVVRTTTTRRKTTLARVHRVRRLPDRWRTELRGVPVARPELIALQLFSVLTEGRAERLVERMWSMRLLSGRSIEVFLDELGERGRNGTAGLRAYLAARGRGYVPTSTGLEARSMQLFREAGIPMRRQVDSGGDLWVGRVDFRHETLPVIAEIQSEAYHSALLDREHDRRRRAALEAAGFVVVEITDDQVWIRPWEVAPAVLAGIAQIDQRS